MTEAEWQRLDAWLWCARVARHRADCARLIEDGRVRINRQPTMKPHARLRVGDVLTLALGREVRVMTVLALAVRRGPAPEAQGLYRLLPEASPGTGEGCDTEGSAAYPTAANAPAQGLSPGNH